MIYKRWRSFDRSVISLRSELRTEFNEKIFNNSHSRPILCRIFWWWHSPSYQWPASLAGYGPLVRYVKLRVAHAPGMPGTFYPPPTSKETPHYWSRHASRHVRHARTVMHVGITKPLWRRNVAGNPGACATRNFTYLIRVSLPIYSNIRPKSFSSDILKAGLPELVNTFWFLWIKFTSFCPWHVVTMAWNKLLQVCL